MTCRGRDEEALPPDQKYAAFEATVTVRLPDDVRVSTSTTISIWNWRHYMRRRGVLRPPATYEPALVRSGGKLTGGYTLRNTEENPIHLTGVRIDCVLPMASSTTTLWPRAFSSRTVSRLRLVSTRISSGSHWW